MAMACRERRSRGGQRAGDRLSDRLRKLERTDAAIPPCQAGIKAAKMRNPAEFRA
jgi:hypothetical protein